MYERWKIKHLRARENSEFQKDTSKGSTGTKIWLGKKKDKIQRFTYFIAYYSLVPTTKNQIINEKEREKKTHGNRSIVKVEIKNIF